MTARNVVRNCLILTDEHSELELHIDYGPIEGNTFLQLDQLPSELVEALRNATGWPKEKPDDK